MKQSLRIFFTTISALWLLSNSALASHISGGDISYQCLGNHQYLITLNLFRDCSGITMSSSDVVNITSSCGTQTVNVTLQNGTNGTEISQLCVTQQPNSTCNGGSLPGMQRYTYTGTVTLMPCADWVMSWSTCCRNNTVNVPTSTGDGSYIEATMNSAIDTCNNSPVFTAQPIPYVCANQQVIYNWGITEVDGDSTTYSLIDGRSAAGVPLNYTAPYSATNPINGMTINSLTGQITFTPTTLGNFIVVVLVNEYDSAGNLIGTTMRDIQFVVQTCSNNPPSANQGQITNLTGTADTTGAYSLEMCDGGNFSFTISIADPNPGDVVNLTSNITSILPGSVFTTTAGNPATATFTWTAPGSSQFFNYFTLFANDGACPVPGIQSFLYQVSVIPGTVASPDTSVLCGAQTAQLAVMGGSSFVWSVVSGDPMNVGTNFTCDTCQYPVANPSVTTIYQVVSNLTTTNCVNKDTIEVKVVPDFTYTKAQSDSAICLQEQVQFVVTPDATSASYSYYWTPVGIYDDNSISNPTATFYNSGTKTVYFEITSHEGCSKDDSMLVVVSTGLKPAVVITGDTTVCLGDSTQLNATITNSIPTSCGLSVTGCVGGTSDLIIGTGTSSLPNTSYPAPYGNWYEGAKHEMLFTAAEMNALGFQGGEIAALSLNVASISGTTVYNNFEIKMGCTSLTSLSTYQSGLVTVFPAQTINIVTGWNTHTFATGFDWDGTSNVIVDICFNNQPTIYTTNSPTYYTTTSFNSVIYSNNDNNPTLCSSPPFTNVSNNRPNVKFAICTGGSTANYAYTWSPSIGLSDTSIVNPWATPPADTTYSVIVTDTVGGCSDTASINLYLVPNFTYTKIQSDDTICMQEQVQFVVTPDSTTPPYIYAWTPGIIFNYDSINNPIGTFNSSGTKIVHFQISNSAGCNKNDSMSVLVAPAVKPNLAISADTTVCVGDSTQLKAIITNAIPLSCGLSANPCSGASNQIDAGTGTGNLGSFAYPAPYGNWWLGAKHELLFTKAEMNALGFQGGEISSLALNVAAISGTTSYENFEIKMGCTADSALTNWDTAGLVTVFPAQTITIAAGWNTHTFATGFDWDGQSNIIVDICFNNLTGTSNSATYYTTTTFNSVLYYTAFTNDVCSNPGAPTTSNLRPNVRFSTCGGTPSPTYAYSWTPDIWLNNDSAPNPISTPQNDTTYTLVVVDTIGGCGDTTSIKIYVVPNFLYTKIQSDDTICMQEQVQFVVTPDSTSPPYVYAWTPTNILNDTTISNPLGTFNSPGTKFVYFEISSAAGCSKEDSMKVLVAPAVKPNVTITGDTTVCIGDSTLLKATINNAVPLSCGLSITGCSGVPSQVTVGTGTNVLPNTSYPAPYGNWYEGAKHEILFTAAELNALGFNGGQFTALALNVASISGTTAYNNFEIKMGCTSLTSLSTYQTGLVTVFPAQTVNITTGLNTHIFVTGFDWDGTSNIIVDICFNNQPTIYTLNSPTYYTTTSFNSVIYTNNDNNPTLCSSPPFINISNNRPNVKFTVCGGTPPSTYAYHWSPGIWLNDSTNQTTLSTPLSDTTYTVIVADVIGGCADTANVKVHLVPNFTYTQIQSDDTICMQEQVQFVVTPDSSSPPYIYAWTPANILNDTTIFNPIGTFNSSGTKYVHFEISSAAGCNKNDSMKVLVAPAVKPDVTITGDTTVCLGDSTQLKATINNSVPLSCGLSANPCSGAGTLIDAGTGTNLLPNTSYPAPYGNWWLGAKHQLLFKKAELNALGFQGGEISSLALNVGAISGTTSFENFEIKMGCTANTSLTNWETGLVTVFPAQTITIAAGWNTHTFANSFDWDGQSNIVVDICFNNINASTNSSTYYTATVFNSVLYYVAFTNDVCSNPLAPTTSNLRPNVRFNTCASAPPSTYAYHWSPGTWLSDSLNQITLSTPQADTTYTVIVIDAIGGCADTANITVHAAPLFAFQVSPTDTAVCLFQTVQFNVTPDPGTYTYHWTPPTYLNNDTAVANPTAGPMTVAGNFTYNFTISSAQGCDKKDSVKIKVSSGKVPNITVTSTPNDSVCRGSNAQLTANNSNGGQSSTYTYNWTPPAILSNPAIYNPTATDTATTTYQVIVTDTIGHCGDTANFTLTIIQLPLPVIADSDTVFCINDPFVTFTATPIGGTWSGSGTTTGGQFSPSLAGVGQHNIKYTVTVNGCVGDTTLKVKVYTNPPVPQPFDNNPYCAKSSIDSLYTLTIDTTGTIVWYRDSALNDTFAVGNPVFNATTGNSTFTLWLRDQSINGCLSKDTELVVQIVPNPTASFTATPTTGVAPLDVSFHNTSQPDTNHFHWDFGGEGSSTANNPTFIFKDTGTYTVILTDTTIYGCKDTAQVTIIVQEDSKITVPNIFTPNGDGKNDVFKIVAENLTAFHIVIFNRWGREVFESGDITNSWDGKGHPAGTYFYVIIAKDRHGNLITSDDMRGTVTMEKEN